MKRVNLTTYDETLSFRDEAHGGKWAIKGCTALLKALARIRRDTEPEKEVERVTKEYEEHKESEAYKKWKTSSDEKRDDHYVRGDKDPEGFEHYMKVCKDPINSYMSYVTACAKANPRAAELQAKSLTLLIAGDQFEAAVLAATNLCMYGAADPKTPRALSKFEVYAKEQAEEKKDDAKAGRAEKIAEFNAGPLKQYKADRADLEKDAIYTSTMEFAHERIKMDAGAADKIVASLDSDKESHVKVYLAERTHKRLVKMGKKDVATKFMEKATAIYAYSPYFNGAKAEKETV